MTRTRVVSLVPSSTETLLALGADVVACTRFCEQPQLTHVGGTKDPDIHAIAELGPDLVVMDREENRREDHEALVERGLDVEVLHVAALADVAPEMTRLAERVGVRFVGPVLGPAVRPSTTAFVPIWRRPWMTVGPGTYGASLLGHLGIATAFADRADAYPTLSEDELLRADIDVVLAPSEPYPFAERHRADLERFGDVVFVDGQDLFWWGARTEAAVARLRSALASVVS